jgi:RNA polymerase sigma-70 factor (ECF subfamily)
MDDQALLKRLIADDEEAFYELYATYKKRLIYYIMRFVKSEDSAEDIFQDVFTSVWQNRHMFDSNTSFTSYLYAMVRNRVLNQFRTLSHQEKFLQYINTKAIDYTDNTEETIKVNDLYEALEKAIKLLSDRQREIFEMSRKDQLSHAEIAEKLGISINTVQQHLSSSLHIIRNYLKNN